MGLRKVIEFTMTNNLPQFIGTLIEVRAGKAEPFTREKLSAINKYPVQGKVSVNYMGLATDEQADRRHHGGYLKAVHQMPITTYQKINEAFGLITEIGMLGENLTVITPDTQLPMQESNVCIGDVYFFGEIGQDGNDNHGIKLKIVQPRRPCYKINDQLGHYEIAKFITMQGIAGWYFQVVQDGELCHGLPVYLVARPYPFADLATLWQLSNQKQTIPEAVLNQWLSIPCLEDSWKEQLYKKRTR